MMVYTWFEKGQVGKVHLIQTMNQTNSGIRIFGRKMCVVSELRGVCLKSILATIHSTSEEHGDRRRSFLRAKNNKEHSIYKSMTGGRYQ